MRAVCVVTGCSEGGLGFALVRALAHRNCIVIATVRRTDSLKQITELSTAFPNSIIQPFVLDVRERESVSRCVKDVLRQFNRIDILINNAGTSFYGPVSEMSLLGFRTILETNVFGMLNMTQEIVPHMKRQGYGQIINIGSIAGFYSIPFSAGYCATKSAVASLTQALQVYVIKGIHFRRMELTGFGIKVALVIPCGLETNISENSLKLSQDVQVKERKLLTESLSNNNFQVSSLSMMSGYYMIPPSAEPSCCLDANSAIPEPPPRNIALRTPASNSRTGSAKDVEEKKAEILKPIRIAARIASLKQKWISKHSQNSNAIIPEEKQVQNRTSDQDFKVTCSTLFPNDANDYIADRVAFKILNAHQDTSVCLPFMLWASSTLFWYFIAWIYYSGLLLPASFIEALLVRRFISTKKSRNL